MANFVSSRVTMLRMVKPNRSHDMICTTGTKLLSEIIGLSRTNISLGRVCAMYRRKRKERNHLFIYTMLERMDNESQYSEHRGKAMTGRQQ